MAQELGSATKLGIQLFFRPKRAAAFTSVASQSLGVSYTTAHSKLHCFIGAVVHKHREAVKH